MYKIVIKNSAFKTSVLGAFNLFRTHCLRRFKKLKNSNLKNSKIQKFKNKKIKK